jgi:hypothetical protein
MAVGLADLWRRGEGVTRIKRIKTDQGGFFFGVFFEEKKVNSGGSANLLWEKAVFGVCGELWWSFGFCGFFFWDRGGFVGSEGASCGGNLLVKTW